MGVYALHASYNFKNCFYLQVAVEICGRHRYSSQGSHDRCYQICKVMCHVFKHLSSFHYPIQCQGLKGANQCIFNFSYPLLQIHPSTGSLFSFFFLVHLNYLFIIIFYYYFSSSKVPIFYPYHIPFEKMLRSQLLPQLAHVVSCELWSKSSGFINPPLTTCHMSKLWQQLYSQHY